MSHSPESESFLVPEEERPKFLFEVNGKKYLLKWDNTAMQEFSVGHGEFDHFYHIVGPEEGIIAFRQQVDGEIWDFLVDNNFPRRINPELDERTIESYISMKTFYMDKAPPVDL